MISNVVIIDDSDAKAERIYEILSSMINIIVRGDRRDVGTGILMLEDFQETILANSDEWLIVIDMQMPPYPGAPIDSCAGFRVLREMKRYGFACPAIIVSSESVDDEKAVKYYFNYKGSIRFQYLYTDADDFKVLLKEYL